MKVFAQEIVPVEALRGARTTFFVRSNVAKNSYHNYIKFW